MENGSVYRDDWDEIDDDFREHLQIDEHEPEYDLKATLEEVLGRPIRKRR